MNIIKNRKRLINTKIVTAFFNTQTEYKCFCCSKSYQKKFVENLMKPDINKFIVLSWKAVYPFQ